MARGISLGTPDKTKRYVFPLAIGRRVLFLSLLGAGLLTVVVFGLSVVGFERLVSPGPLASGHAPLDARCEQCHARGRAADLRCERCHDAASAEAWRIEAHRRYASEISTFAPASTFAAGAEKKNPLRCAECHGDHRGRTFPLARVDDRQCARCHRKDTPSMAGHVEFALVKAKATPPRGMKISHDRHVLEALAKQLRKKAADLTADEKKKGLAPAVLQKLCETCHVSTSDLKGFEPIDFDRHCVDCHTKDGSVGATDPMPVADVVPIERVQAPWAAGMAGQFASRRDKVSKTFLSHKDPWVLFNLAKIRREVDPAGYLVERTSLAEAIDAERREGVSFALARATDADLARRSDELRSEIAAIQTRVKAPADDRKALGDGLDAFAKAAAVLSAAPASASAASDGSLAGTASTLATRAKTESIGPLPAADLAARRAELLTVLETLRDHAAATKDVLLGRRVDLVLSRVLSLRTGSMGAADVDDDLAARIRERERILDEMAIRKKTGAVTVPPVSRVTDRKAIAERGAEARERLQALAAVEAIPVKTLDAAELASRKETVDSLVLACKKCHDLGTSSLAPLAIDQPVLPRAIFDHKPHVRIRDCAFCHAEAGKGVLTSKNARDVLVPAVDNCRTCHKPSATRADCATCHRFHPPDFPVRAPLRHPSTALLASLPGNPSPIIGGDFGAPVPPGVFPSPFRSAGSRPAPPLENADGVPVASLFLVNHEVIP